MNSKKVSPKFENYISKITNHILNDKNEYNFQEPDNSDSIADILEKLIINNIRTWHLEDLAKEYYNDDAKLADIKRKIDFCFKNVRPKLINALNRLFYNAVKHGHSLTTENVKMYKGYKN